MCIWQPLSTFVHNCNHYDSSNKNSCSHNKRWWLNECFFSLHRSLKIVFSSVPARHPCLTGNQSTSPLLSAIGRERSPTYFHMLAVGLTYSPALKRSFQPSVLLTHPCGVCEGWLACICNSYRILIHPSTRFTYTNLKFLHIFNTVPIPQYSQLKLFTGSTANQIELFTVSTANQN